MDYFSKFLRTGNQHPPKAPVDHAQEFHKSWTIVKNTLMQPDERQLMKGIQATAVPAHLQSIVDALVWESTRTEEGGTGVCLEYLLKNDVLGTLVRLSETDRPAGIQAEVLRAVQNMVVLLDEQFLVHSAVHRAVLRLLRNCAGDDLQEQIDGRSKVMGAARNVTRGQPSEYEEDLVNLLCILCSRIRNYRELLMIFFHDKHWYRSEPLFSVEEDEDEDEDATLSDEEEIREPSSRPNSPTPSQTTITSGHPPPLAKKSEYEFLLFNYLLRFVHREGQIGEFARAGLLFLMDIAMSSEETDSGGSDSKKTSNSDPVNDAALALAEYILDGDFSEVLGAGLGAVYSLLPSKLGFLPTSSGDISSGSGMMIGSTGAGPEEEKEKLELERSKSRDMGIEDARSPDLKFQLDHFLKLLEFLQDVLKRKGSRDSMDASSLVGAAIVQSILDAVRRIFLENVLYPSILECSDADGSAVAVISYIEIMIRTLQEGPLSNLFVEFLLSEDSDEFHARQHPHAMLTLGDRPPKTTSRTRNGKQAKLRRRKSSAMMLLEMEAPGSRKQSSYFTSMGRFTLKDLLLSNLRSNSQASGTSALQLLQSMLIYHPRLSIERILLVIPDLSATIFPHPALISPLPASKPSVPVDDEDDDDTFHYPGVDDDEINSYPNNPSFLQPETTYSTHEREMGLYLTLISRVDPTHNGDVFSTGYEHYLRDALFAIQNQSAYCLNSDNGTLQAEDRPRLKHRLNVNDPVISSILESTRKFFLNTPEFNIALTGVLATLALHPDRSLAGWLTFASSDTPTSNERADQVDMFSDDGDDRSIDFKIGEKLANDTNYLPAARMDEYSRPVVHTIFHGLITQLEKHRQQVDKFDKYLIERRQGLLFSENLTDALNLVLDVADESSKKPPAVETPQKPKAKPKATTSSSFVSFLTPKKNRPSRAPSEPATPPAGRSKTIAASPFGPHYQQTESISIEPQIALIPGVGVWSPAKPLKWNADEDDVFTSGWMENRDYPHARNDDADKEEAQPERPLTVSLSQLLDNVVILEESIKELVAIIHARRSLGIDALRYL